MRTTARVLAALLAGGMLLTACGRDSDDGDGRMRDGQPRAVDPDDRQQRDDGQGFRNEGSREGDDD